MARLQGSTGVEERGMHAWGFPRNLGGPIFSTDRNVVGEATTRNNPGPATRGVDPAGSEQQAHGWYFAAKATELRETGDGKSERSVVAARELETNLQSLLDRAKSGERYKAPPVRRVYIPKGDGSTRPLGIPTFEDKVLQRAVVMAMEPVYEHDFLDCSYGFRPGRSAHQALETGWKRLMDMGGGWVLEADLGGGIVKKRIALPGRGKRGSTRTLLATNRNDRWFFVFGFEKNERVDISENELESLKKVAKDLLGLTSAQIAVALGEGSLVEVEHEAGTT